jgi:hypothetical protein
MPNRFLCCVRMRARLPQPLFHKQKALPEPGEVLGHHHVHGLGHTLYVPSSWRVCWSFHLNYGRPRFCFLFGLCVRKPSVFRSFHVISPLCCGFCNFII